MICRDQIVSNFPESSIQSVHSKTVECRIRPVLAAKNIHLRRIGHRTRCYTLGSALEAVLSSALSSSTKHAKSLTEKERWKHLDTVRNRFQEHCSQYWEGKWNLNEEISNIPQDLWAYVILQTASKRMRNTWKIAAAAQRLSITKIFPVSNSTDILPRKGLESCLSESSSQTDYVRTDLLLCVRAQKVIEQIVFARTNSTPGPLTVCLSISGIVELSPSFRSVENVLGLGLSYNVTETYKNRLISEREKASADAWSRVRTMDEGSLPLCQFDNWDLLPLHAVKADGKAMPKVNGSLVQGAYRKRKAEESYGPQSTLILQTQSLRLEWKPVSVHGDRMDFANKFTSVEHTTTIDDFIDIVFGLTAADKDQLANFSDVTTGMGIHPFDNLRLKPSINFRSLLLSAFKPHGGANFQEGDLFEQHVVYVDISRESAADILSVRRMVDLIRNLLRPRSQGCPHHVVISGDQPSYKMLVEIWLASWREQQNSTSSTSSTGDFQCTHEWMIPFPGFFHAEKQALYSLCKEQLDGVGLSELAECAGLSAAQVSNILKHGHARNNRALLFSFACALAVHSIDIVTAENPALLNTPPKQRTGLFSKTCSKYVRDDVLSLGAALNRAVRNGLCCGPNGKHFVGTATQYGTAWSITPDRRLSCLIQNWAY